ncbi:HNH endonuclease [Oceanobacillus caeni]
MKELNFEEVKHEMTPIPGFNPEYYLCHTGEGKIYSLISNRWLLSGDVKGVGDKGYLMTYLKRELPNGETAKVPMYLHWAVYSSVWGETVEKLRRSGTNGELLEIDHLDGNVKNNKIENLQLGSSADNKKNRSYDVEKTILTQQNADAVREKFKSWNRGKMEFYEEMAKIYNCTKRTIQNAILGNTYVVK